MTPTPEDMQQLVDHLRNRLVSPDKQLRTMAELTGKLCDEAADALEALQERAQALDVLAELLENADRLAKDLRARIENLEADRADGEERERRYRETVEAEWHKGGISQATRDGLIVALGDNQAKPARRGGYQGSRPSGQVKIPPDLGPGASTNPEAKP